MQNNNIDILQLIVQLNDMIYGSSQFTLENEMTYAPVKDEIQLISFNNQIVKKDTLNNRYIIKDPETICNSIYFIDDDQFINIAYVPQENSNIIKYSVNYNKITGITEYKICNIQQEEKQQFFTTELNDINTIKQLIDENGQNNASSIFKDILNNNVLRHTTNMQLAFNTQSNGKIDIKNIEGVKRKNKSFIEQLQQLETLTENKFTIESGYFRTNACNLSINLVANGINTSSIIIKKDKRYLRRLRLIDWDNNVEFNKKYLEEHGVTEIKRDLAIKRNTIIPLCYDGHASLIMSDIKNTLYQYNTGFERNELGWLEDKCTVKQRGQCCGYSIQSFILHNKKQFNIAKLKQNDEIINKKIIEYSKTNNVDATDYFIKMNENRIRLSSNARLYHIKKRQLFCETCFYMQYISNIQDYVDFLSGKNTSKSINVKWDKDQNLLQYKNKHGTLDNDRLIEKFKKDTKNQLDRTIREKDRHFFGNDNFDDLGSKTKKHTMEQNNQQLYMMTDQEISQQVRKNIQAMFKGGNNIQYDDIPDVPKQKPKTATLPMTQNE